MIKLKECRYCGNNPVPHRLNYINETLMVALTPINRLLTARWFYRYADWAADQMFVGLAKFLALLGILKFSDDYKNSTIERAKVLWEEAIKRNYKMEAAVLLGKQLDYYRVKLPGRALIYFSGLPRPNTGSETLAWLDDKAILKIKLKSAGIPIPEGKSCTTYAEALKVWQKLGRPVIVKPRLGSRGRHSFTNINNSEELKRAFEIAQELCHFVMVEEYLPGTLYRGTMIGGKLVGAMGWSAPEVTGDGAKTVDELIVKKNNERAASVTEIKIDTDLQEIIQRQGAELNTVLEKGKKLILGKKIGAGYGGTSFEITDILHQELKAILERAAGVVNDPIIGFDFIIEDPASSPASQKFGIIEANGLPFIHFHHYPVVGKPNNVAKHVWNLFDPKTTQ